LGGVPRSAAATIKRGTGKKSCRFRPSGTPGASRERSDILVRGQTVLTDVVVKMREKYTTRECPGKGQDMSNIERNEERELTGVSLEPAIPWAERRGMSCNAGEGKMEAHRNRQGYRS